MPSNKAMLSMRTIFLSAKVTFRVALLFFFTYVTGAAPAAGIALAAVLSAICAPFVWWYFRDRK